MKRRVVITKAKRERVGRAPRLGDQLRLKPATGRWHPRRLSGRWRRVVREHNFDFAVAGNSARSARQCPAEKVDRLSHGALLATLSKGSKASQSETRN